MSNLTKNDIGEILDLFIDEHITDFNPSPGRFQQATKQVYNRYLREHSNDNND